MAAKKNWRDEYREKTANSAKNGNWRDSVSGNGVGSVNATSDWRSAYGDDTASTAAGNIINRVNTWIENHNNYITNYQNRYSGRKYNYEDDYVMDSASWLDTVRKQKSNFDAEADSILSYMDQYQDYLDKDWMKSVRETLTGASGTQAKIIESATKDNEWWNSFGSDQELLDEYGSAEDVYKYFQRSDGYSKKYNGMTSEELYGLVGDLDDGEEKSWLSSYASSVDYDEKGKADLNEVAKELDDLGNLYDQAFTIDLWYDEYKRGLTPYDAQKLEAYNRLKNEFGGDAKAVKKAYEQKEQYLKSATDIQKLNSLSAVSGNEDFGQKSEYVSNVEYGLLGKPEFTDNTYAYINNPTVEDKRALGAGQITARDLIGTEYSAYAADSPLRNRDSSYQREALEYIKPEEVKVYNYLYATEGEKKANEYLDLLVSTFQARKNVQTAENVAKFAGEHPILSSALSVGTSIGSGFEYLEDIIEYGGDKLMGKDAELGMNESALVTNAVRSTVSDKVDWEIGNWDAFDFLYNTTMSGVDSFASTAFGGLGGTVLGLSAAAQGTNDALQRGMSNGQAFWNGLISGVFEGLFETISIGNFNKLKDTALNVGLKNIDRSIVKTITKNIGKSMLVNASEEMLTELANITYDTLINGEFANYTIEELFTDGQWKNALNQVIESGASGALMGMGMSMLGSTIGLSKGVKNANAYAVENFGGQTDAFIQEGLENDVKSNSYKLATKYQQQVQGKDGKQGKALTGQQIRNLLAANQEQITPNDIKKIQKAAEKRLTDLGQTEDVAKVAELATKRATGQKLTRAETSFLANSQYGSRVANELLPENIMSGDYATEWAEGIGTKKVNKLAYNIKSILEEMSNIPAGYKSLEKRVSEEDKFSVSESGQATIRSTDQAIDLSKVEVADFVRDKETGKITDMILKADGKEVKASEIDYADDNQSYLFSAVKNIENITPGDATAFIRDYNPSSGQSVGEYLNGIDEAFTYGYHRYSEADMGAGLFTPKLTSEQAKGAYILGQTTRNKSDTNKSEAIKRMRTAVEAETEKAKAEGKAAPKAKELTITYNEGRGKIRDFAKTGMKLHDKQGAGVEIAQILHKLGLGTNFEFFSSYVSKSMKVKDQKTGEAMYARVFINDAGVEEVAPAGVYRKSDGTIRIDLNAYNGRGLTLNALAHELTHFIQQWSDTKYQVLADFLVKTYEKTDMTMHQRVIAEQARLKDIRGKEVSYNEAYDEVVAKAMMKMFDDGKLAEKLTELASVDKTIVEKLLERIRDLFKKFLGFYNSDVLYKDSDDLVGMKDAFEQLQNMFAEALVEASENFQTSLIAKEAGIDIMPVEDGSMYSYSSLAEAAGFAAVENEDGTRSFTREGKKVSKVTINDIDNSPIGAFINFSLEMGDISEADAERQKKMFADICTMACKTNDFAMTMQFVGSAVFTGMKANADKQYGTTYDFPSICTKTQAVIDAMSAKMVSLGRGLNTNEIVQLYEDVFASGNPVPCPECYVFSRWIGIGGLLDNIKKYQDYYGDMNVKDVAAAYLEMKAEVSKFAEEQGISFGKAKGALTAKLTKEFNKLTEKIEKAQNQGEKVKPADKQRLAELEPMMNTVKSMTWLENVYFADSSLKKVNPNFRVPDSVLFDLNNGEAFATKYKEAWAFRTTQGAGYGKAITPYAEARLGEGVLVTNNTTKTIKGRADGSLDNYFLQQMGKLDKKSRDALKRARMKQKIQAFIGGQRFQSTSDARYENASDYLLAALEMQAMGGMVQVYTKVDGAVPAFSAWGFSINQSLMPLNGGLDADGNVKDTGVGGMNPKVAFENRKKHESAGTITIGVNDNHIRAMFKQLVRDFIIPYHASGGKADTIAEFRRIQEGREAKGEAVRSTDYSRTQSDKVLSDEVLRWQGKTDAQIQRIHEIRNARIAILTGGNPNMTVVRSNRFLSALYEKLNGGEWDGVKLAKSKVESQIFPNEFWDQTVTYEESAKITKDYLEYCEDLGFLHRFSGMIPSNGKLIPANGYNENGERVQLTDLAYKYDEKGNKTAEVEEFFWKVLTDRRMYDNNGKYLAQKVVTLNDTTTDTVTGFAKNNQGREYDKAKAEALAKKITNGEQYSSQETDADKKKNRAFNGSPLTRRSVKQRSVGSTHIKMPSTAAAEILGIENISNYSDSVNMAVAALGELYVSVDKKIPVLGFRRPVSASSLEGALVTLGVLKRGGTSGSAYRYENGHALRISNHSAKAENFKGAGEHLSLVLYEKGKLNDFEEAKSNVIEAVFKYRYLDSNPDAFKRLIHDIAHFIVKGEYHDTAGAMRYNFSGTEAFKKRAEKRMVRDGVARDQRGEVYSSQETDADIGYHAGDLGKAESLRQQGLGRDTGHFGTGTYFVGNKASVEGYNTRNGKPAPVETVDFNKYNLFKPKNAHDGFVLHDFLRGVDGYWNRDADAVNTMEEYESLQEKLSELVYDIESEEFGETDPNKESWMAVEREFLSNAKRMMGGYKVGKALTDTLSQLVDGNYQYDPRSGEYYSYDFDTDKFTSYTENEIIRLLNAEEGGWRAFESIEKLADDYYSYSRTSRYESWSESIKDVANVLGVSEQQVRNVFQSVTEDIASRGYTDADMETADSAATRFMKALGYEGIDVRGIKQLDNTTYGSVIYDLKGEDLARKKEIGTARYSTQETDNISNRDLLANAFEGLVQNSEEYKLIQEYKGRIRLLNEYEEKLSELNAEIRKLTFSTEGERDSKKLKELQKEAKEVAGDINRNDKILVSLEASEPLRKVIEQERKKEAQKTKAHVKELLQNKKSRAEQTELRHKIRKAVRDLDKLLNRGNKKQNVKEDMKSFVSKALELADYIFTDHVTNDDLIRRGITVRMTPREEALVKETEDILNQLYDNADSLTDEEFTRLDAKRKANEEKLRDLLKAQRNESLNTPVYNLFDDLVSEYASLKNSSQDSVKAAYNEELENSLRAFMSDDDRVKILKNMRVADMTTEELNWLYRAYTMVLTNVRNANKFHVNGMNATIEQVVGQLAGDFGSRKIPDKKMAIAMQKLVNKLGWDYEKLYYALDRIGSEAFTKLIMNIADSENTVMQDVMEAAAFRDKMVETYGFNNWDVNKEIDREFLDNTGKKFKLTLGQLMALYAYSRREGAWDHIEYGGFVFGEAALTNPRPADSYKLSKEQCEAITNLLTKEQKGYAEDMQKYLSETMGAKGNEVSMLLYGIKMFGEKNYFPIHIAGQFKAQAQESQAKAAAGFGSMSNAGFTHAQNPNAKAPFVLEGFNEIWVDHVNEMSRYHGTVPALEDLRRVMNRSTYSDAVAESQSIKQLMENSYGKEAVEYFDNLYREANSGAITDKLQKTSKKLLSMFRKNSVAYSLSVLIQQPTSITRAYAMIDKKYFGFKGFGSITSGVAKAVSDKWTKAHTNAYNEMLKYAPGVTMAKEIGGFDTHTGGSIRSYLLDTKKSLKQKWNTGTAMEKGKAVLDLVDDNAIANLPNLADKIAWIEIWNACKRETVATHKDLAANSEEFMKVVGDRFTEVIRATQVYDSMFAKSPMLKSKNLAVQYLVSFMNEPNTVANMAESALRDAVRGNWKDGVKKAIVLAYGTIAVGMAKSLIYAMRDDDEDETFVEKYIESLTGSLLSDFNPISYIPVARDVLSAAQGYDVERPDMAIVVDAISALDAVIKNNSKDTEGMSEEQLAELDKKVTDANWKLVESLAAFFGIPVKNIRRDVKGVFDHAMIASANAGQTTVQSAFDKVYDAVVESVPFLSAPSKQDKLYEAIISGDTEYVNRLKSTYKSDDAYDSAVRKALRENDPRIKEAAQARYDGNTEEYKRIFREIQKEGKFSFDNIMGAINAEVSKLTPDKVSSDYTASEFVESIVLGDTKSAQAMKEDIIATKVANGKSKSEAEKDFASNVATGIREAYTSGLLDEAGAEKMLVEYADKDEEETVSKVSYWSFIEEHKEYKDDLSESNVKDYKEFAEPAEIPLDVFVQYVEGTKGLTSKKDEWGDVEVTKREQVLEVIDSLPLTWEQKDALYLAAGYSENQIWDVPW